MFMFPQWTFVGNWYGRVVATLPRMTIGHGTAYRPEGFDGDAHASWLAKFQPEEDYGPYEAPVFDEVLLEWDLVEIDLW